MLQPGIEEPSARSLLPPLHLRGGDRGGRGLPPLGLADYRAASETDSKTEFAEVVGAKHAVAVNSCTAALHLAVDALRLQPGQAVLVPTMTFAATAEVVCYQKAVPILVDCDPVTPQHGSGRRREEVGRPANRPLPARPEEAEAGGHHSRPRRRADDGHGRSAGLRRQARIVGGRRRGARLACGLPPRAGRPVAPLRRKHRRRHLLLLLRQQDHHHRRRRHGRDRRRPIWPSACADVAPRAVARRLEPVFGQQAQLGLPDRRRRLQVQSDRHCRRHRHPSTCAGRDPAAWSGKCWPAGTSKRWRISTRSTCLPIRPTAFTPGTSFRSACGWRGSPSTAISAWSCCATGASAARSIGGRCTCTPIIKLAHGWKPRDLPVATAVWERLISLPLFPGMREEEQDTVIAAIRSLGKHGRVRRRIGRAA